MRKSVMKIPMIAVSQIMQPLLLQLRLFINFRGKDIRYGFLSHLIAAFELYGINFFTDKDEQKGKDLSILFKRIKESHISLAIFSKRYGQSRWCLNELAKMKKLAENHKLEVIPIFYKVKVEDVRYQKGEFGRHFWKLAKRSSGSEIKKWKEALEFFTYKMGLTLYGKSSEANFVKEIVEEMEKIQKKIHIKEKELRSLSFSFSSSKTRHVMSGLNEFLHCKRSNRRKF